MLLAETVDQQPVEVSHQHVNNRWTTVSHPFYIFT